jgi:primosomal protein N' (replication factor Y)
VLPDVAALAALGRTFDYLVPPGMAPDVTVGSVVRISLHGRSVSGWVVAVGVTPPSRVRLRPLSKVSSLGPSAEMVELSDWAAWRWAGRRNAFLRAASPPHVVRDLPPSAPRRPALPTGPGAVTVVADPDVQRDAVQALAAGQAVVRLAPAQDPFGFVVAAAGSGSALVVVPSTDQAALLAGRMRRAGLVVATTPQGWPAAAAGGCSVVGARAAAWAPAPDLGAVVVVDAHDETLVDERAPTWSAWIVAAERARRASVPCLLLSACPTLEQLAWGRLILPSRSRERAGWPAVHVVDRRRDDPRTGLLSERVVELVRAATPQRRVLCVLNRKGRATLLVCATCGEVAGCERCGAALGQSEPGQLHCRNCGASRPVICAFCGSSRLKLRRVGVSRLREELEALARQPVGEISSSTEALADAAVVVGTEALLHRASGWSVSTVVFLDFDAEILAPRYRAGEQALGLLVRAARLLGGRAGQGVLVVQTRRPEHPAILAAVRADPSRLAEHEWQVRRTLGLPPTTAIALLSGAAAPAHAAALAALGRVEVLDSGEGRWLVRAPDHVQLCDALAAVPRPSGRLRVEVDPLRI